MGQIYLDDMPAEDKAQYLHLLEKRRTVRAQNSLIEFSKQVEIPDVPILVPKEGELFPYNNMPAEHHELILQALEDAAYRVEDAKPWQSWMLVETKSGRLRMTRSNG